MAFDNIMYYHCIFSALLQLTKLPQLFVYILLYSNKSYKVIFLYAVEYFPTVISVVVYSTTVQVTVQMGFLVSFIATKLAAMFRQYCRIVMNFYVKGETIFVLVSPRTHFAWEHWL